jgi:hypothetical protein
MSVTVCLLANTIGYPEGGGHLWVYLNWALGLRALGCRVIWLELINQTVPASDVRAYVTGLKKRLDRYDFGENVAVHGLDNKALPPGLTDDCLDLDAAAEADLLLNMRHDPSLELIARFRRSALLDIDPGILQFWMAKGMVSVAQHDVYFTIGETVGQPGARFPDGGVPWHYTPPCVALDWWVTHPAAKDASFTTISHWNTYDEWIEDDHGFYANDKRNGFLPFLDLPRHTTQPLELALCLVGDENERTFLKDRGWHIREAWEVASMPWDYQQYIQRSRGEFSCAKPSCIRFENAWISDRTICYLASGKPAIVQHTGPSRFLPDAAGLFRFRTVDEAVRCVEAAATDYLRHCRLARALAEDQFDARKIVTRLLARALR